jgi:hypothetical protein
LESLQFPGRFKLIAAESQERLFPMAVPNNFDMQEIERRYDECYERFGKSLEAEHTGEFLAIDDGGNTVLGSDRTEVAERADRELTLPIFLYRVGHRAVGRWLTPFRPSSTTERRLS